MLWPSSPSSPCSLGCPYRANLKLLFSQGVALGYYGVRSGHIGYTLIQAHGFRATGSLKPELQRDGRPLLYLPPGDRTVPRNRL